MKDKLEMKKMKDGGDKMEDTRLAWENHDQEEQQQHSDSGEKNCCCCNCPPCCSIFFKYTLGRSLQLFFYVLDIATDITVATADYRNGDVVFAGITLGLVFAPGFLYSLFAFTQVFYNNTGLLVCIKAPFWILVFPLLPLWPVARDLHQIYHSILAFFSANRQHHLDQLNKPSQAYLVKFLEAFTEAAPQILLRLYKITLRNQNFPFYEIAPMEYVQLSFSLMTLANKIVSTYQKNISTVHIVNGDMENYQRFKLPCGIQILAFFWWVSFLIARFQVMAMFAGALKWWIFVAIGIHVLLVFLFQTVAAGKDRVKRIFIYLFSAFIFIFAYLEFNMKARLKVTSWFPYTIYTILVFIENSVMLVTWYFTQQSSMSADLTPEDQDIFKMHRIYLIFFQYGAFCVSIVMMILTFCCAPNASSDPDDHRKNDRWETSKVRGGSSPS